MPRRNCAFETNLILVIARSSKMTEDLQIMRLILALALSLAPLTVSAPAAAQQRSLTIFGDDKCPSDTICVVAPESERYRIPKPFRESLRKDAPDRVSWAIRSQATLDVANKAPSSCAEPTVGGGGWAGCFLKQMKEAYAEKKPEPEVP
jgi:hypothetical protein